MAEAKKPDLRDAMWQPKTAVGPNDRKLADMPMPSRDEPHLVEPGPEVHVPGQTTKQ